MTRAFKNAPLVYLGPNTNTKKPCLSPMWERFLSTLTHLQVRDNTLKQTHIYLYIEKIQSTSSQVQRRRPGICKYSTEIIWIEIINQCCIQLWRKSCTGQINVDAWLPFPNGIPFVLPFLCPCRPQRSDACLDPLKTHLNQHNVHAERKLLVDGELMSSFGTRVPIITF